MKILKLSKISNFGIFKNFEWDTSLAILANKNSDQSYDFKDVNIFYGRNYSGKTSLSKIIRSLETKRISPKYTMPEFEITLTDSSTITSSSLDEFNQPIYVYNSDFVKENLKFIHDETQDIESFSVTLGGDNQKVLDDIKRLKEELGSNEENFETSIYLDIKNKRRDLEIAEKAFEVKDKYLQNLLKNKASGQIDSIRTQHNKFGDSDYTIAKLRKEIDLVQEPSFQSLSKEAKINSEKLILQIKKDDPPDVFEYNFDFNSITKAVGDILRTEVGQSNKINELIENGSLNKWVEEGLSHHKEKENCAFCSNILSAKRLEVLRQHFDEESKKLKERIENGVLKIKKEMKILNNFNFEINYYYDHFFDDLNQIKSEISNLLREQEKSLDILVSQLESKKDNLFNSMDFFIPFDYSQQIREKLSAIEVIRHKNIEQSNRLKEDQDVAKRDLRLDHIYIFLNENDYNSKILEIEKLKQDIEPYRIGLKNLETRKNEIIVSLKIEEDKLKSEAEACNCINKILANDFGHQALQLKAIEVGSHNGKTIKFEIQRNGLKAHNLSEGECSLISFCYFIARVKDALDRDIKPIIWIDDPISSLDSNHIFFIFSLIQQKICQDKKYKQLFISTHNLEFLKYLRRIDGAESDNSLGNVGELKRKTGYYLIQRIDTISTIRQMPIYLSKFLTEFNYLFDQIYQCATVKQINDKNFNIFYNFGNNARKFLEIYTFYKFPSPKYSLDAQLKVFWGEDIYKTLTDRIHNEYSHMTGVLERGGLITDQPEMQKSAIAIVKKIQKDINQYNALLESIDVDVSLDLLHPDNQANSNL